MTRPASGAPAPRRIPGAPAAAGLGTARIAVDLLGGDNAPAVVVDGALRACGADPDLQLLLVGPEEVADGVILALPAADRDRVAVRPVAGAVGMADPPLRGLHADTTVRAAVAAVAEGQADAVVSAGATGATVAATVLGLGRIPGIRRPPLAAELPALAGPVLLLDVGAAVEASSATLACHAALGAAYAQVVTNLTGPRVGLLSVGTEGGKGDRARRGADAVLTAGPLPGSARYVGLVEGYEPSLGTRADVVVTDGFTGNILLKGIEGAYALAGGSSAAPRAAALLGVRGTVVVCHGAADAVDLAAGIRLAASLHRARAASRLSGLVADLGEVPR